MVLSEFINRHAGETAWLFGKGPSLSTFDFKTAGPLRVAINDVVAHVPNCTYAFANDGVARWRDCYKPGQVLFQPHRCLCEFDSTADQAVACDVIIYEDGYDDTRLYESREIIASGLAIRRGTLGSALQILHIMGVTEVHLVGIDGGRTHADGFGWRTELRMDHGTEYTAIRNEAIDSGKMMGITLKFHDKNQMETDGKIFIKALSNFFAEGVPYCNGQIFSVNPRTATDLVREGAAEYHDAPVKHTIESADAPMQAVESAVVPTRKGKR